MLMRDMQMWRAVFSLMCSYDSFAASESCLEIRGLRRHDFPIYIINIYVWEMRKQHLHISAVRRAKAFPFFILEVSNACEIYLLTFLSFKHVKHYSFPNYMLGFIWRSIKELYI